MEITLNDVKDFLKEQGQIWTGYACPYSTLFDNFRMKKLTDYKELNVPQLVMLMNVNFDQNEEDTNQIIRVNQNNPNLLFLKINRMEFGLYIPENENYFEIDDGANKFIIQKDLTREWLTFLAKRYEGYLDYVNARCIKGKKNTVARSRAIIEKIKLAIKNLNSRIQEISKNNKKNLARYNRIMHIVAEIKGQINADLADKDKLI